MDRGEEIEEIRGNGFSAAANLLVSILDSVKLDCQFLENMKEKRELLIREYEDTDEANLPDEHYQIRMGYFSKTRLLEERAAYDDTLKSLYAETRRLWDLLEAIYQDSKSIFKVNDYEDLVRKNRNRIAGGNDKPKEAERADKEKIRVLLAKMEERLRNISDSMYPAERKITGERLSMLENEFSRFENRINPYNLQPGILMDIDLMSIKRKRTTLDAVSMALGRFLENVSDCFRGAAQASLPK
jgi:FtsZ-binding cell division protein ZapB